jgi:hypothetical protein
MLVLTSGQGKFQIIVVKYNEILKHDSDCALEKVCNPYYG